MDTTAGIQGNHRRRSDTILQTRRQLLDWEQAKPFKILSIDGGGIKGIFPAAILTYLEEHCLNGQPIGDYFDLIAGTSTGGIIALGLAAGLRAKSLSDLYINQGWKVFPPKRYKWSNLFPNPIFRNRYQRDELDRLLEETLGSKKLRESRYRLLIPAAEARNGDPYVFKTPHHPDYRLDGEKRMAEVAAATSAAPTYLNPVIQDGYVLLDGGIWANNPTLMGLIEALTCFNISRENVSVLSIGCGQKGFRINKAQTKGSGQFTWRGIIDVAMHYQSLTAVNQTGLLIGRDRVTRLNRSDESVPIDMDDWRKAKELLPDEALDTARQNEDSIKEIFLSNQATGLTPLA